MHITYINHGNSKSIINFKIKVEAGGGKKLSKRTCSLKAKTNVPKKPAESCNTRTHKINQ